MYNVLTLHGETSLFKGIKLARYRSYIVSHIHKEFDGPTELHVYYYIESHQWYNEAGGQF